MIVDVRRFDLVVEIAQPFALAFETTSGKPLLVFLIVADPFEPGT